MSPKVGAWFNVIIAAWCLIDYSTGGAGWNLWAGLVLLVFAAGNFHFAAGGRKT